MAALLFVAEFILCAVCIHSPEPIWFQDSVLYETIGANLAAGNGYSADVAAPFRPEITRTPLVPAVVAATYAVTGRNPTAVLWLNAVFISLAVVIGYCVLLRLTGDPFAAMAGGALTLAAPFLAGTAATINSEAPGMLQVALTVYLLLRWPRHCTERWAALRAVVLGLLLASLALNRVSLLPALAIAGAFVVSCGLRGRPGSASAWLAVTLFCVSAAAPVAAWAARNASLGLPFSPAPIGINASRVHDVFRYREPIFEGNPPPPPAANVTYFSNWKHHYGPEKLLALEEENRVWLKGFQEEHADRRLAAMPARLLGLFTTKTLFTYPLRDPEGRRFPGPQLGWLSRGLWLFSLLGVVLLWKDPWSRWVWLVPLATLVPVHLATVCTARYMAVLMPLHLTYGGAALAWGYRVLSGTGQSGEPLQAGRSPQKGRGFNNLGV